MSDLDLAYDALGRLPGWQGRLLAIVDYQSGRDRCAHTLDEQLEGEPCDLPLQRRTAHARTRPSVIEAEHAFCGDPGFYDSDRRKWVRESKLGGWRITQELSRRRPGAHQPWDTCAGCILSFFGGDELDKSLEDAARGMRRPPKPGLAGPAPARGLKPKVKRGGSSS